MRAGPGNIGGNELTLAGVVKEDLTCSGSSLPKKKNGWALPDEPSLKRKKIKLIYKAASRVGPPGIIYRVGPPEKFYIYTTIPSHRPSI